MTDDSALEKLRCHLAGGAKTIQHTPMTWCTCLQSFEIQQCLFKINKRPVSLIAPPSGHKQITKGKISQSSSLFELCSNHSSSLEEVISGHYLPPIRLKSLPKSKLGQVGSRFKHCSESLV